MPSSTTEFDTSSASPELSADRSSGVFVMDECKNEFLATLAHELRNPLAPIKNGLQLMAFMKLGDEAEAVRAMMARQLEQIVHLVDDLLDVSRIGCGKLVLDKQVCKIKTVVEAAIDESSILISENGMTLKVVDQSHAACVCGGSTFTVRLPLAKGMPLQSLNSNTVSNHFPRSYRVLVVDDMRALRDITEQLFVKLGHTVQIAESGKLALEMLDSFQPDIVFSDISMPGMSGHDLARRIRERADLRDVYLVAMTGYGQPSDREMAFSAGFDCHLTKPVALNRLRGLFDELDNIQRENIVR